MRATLKRILQPQTGGGQDKKDLFHFVSFARRFLYMPSCVFFVHVCVFRLDPLKGRLPSHLLLNPLCYPSRLVIFRLF